MVEWYSNPNQKNVKVKRLKNRITDLLPDPYKGDALIFFKEIVYDIVTKI
jgi:hypothetical protein